jgi:methyl-accepting chemotaxis protein
MTNQSDQNSPPEHEEPAIPDAAPLSAAIEGVFDRFARTFEASARRWELIVYPSLFAFIVLAAYGFYLIYNLTHDVSILAHSIDRNMGANMTSMSQSVLKLADIIDRLRTDVHVMTANTTSLSQRMDLLESHVATMTANMTEIKGQTQAITSDLDMIAGTMKGLTISVGIISSRMEPIVANLIGMNQYMGAMTFSVTRMGRDVGTMGKAARPISMMNNMMPWGSGFMPW